MAIDEVNSAQSEAVAPAVKDVTEGATMPFSLIIMLSTAQGRIFLNGGIR